MAGGESTRDGEGVAAIGAREPLPRVSDATALGRYRMIADNSSEVVYQTSPDGRIEWIQPTVERLLGWRVENLLGVPARSLVHPDDLELVNRLRLQVYEGTELDDIPCRFRTASGGYRNCAVRARPVRNDTGEIVGAVMTLKDSHDQAAILRALTTLSQGNAVLVRASEERVLLQRMCDTIVASGEYRYAWYGRRLDDEVGSVVPIAQAGGDLRALQEVTISWKEGPWGSGYAGRAIRAGQAQVIVDLEAEPGDAPWRAPYTHYGVRSGIALPVRVHGEIDGVLVVYADEPAVFDHLAVSLMEDLVADLGFGLARLRDVDDLDRSRREAEAQRDRMRATLDSQLDPFVLLEAVRDETGRAVDLRFVEVNDAGLSANRSTRRELLEKTFLEQYPGLAEHGPMALYLRCVETGEPVILDDYLYPNEVIGSERRYDIRGVKTGDMIALTWRDVTERYDAMAEIAASERRYRLLAENASDIVWEINAEGVLTWISESITRVLGWLPDQVLGKSSLDLFHPEGRARASSNRDAVMRGAVVTDEFRMLRADGSTRWMALRAHAVIVNNEVTRIAALRDIEDEVVHRDELARVIRHDPLTGLANRGVVLQRIARLSESGHGEDSAVAVLCIDVDGLGRINEALTNEAGDAVLMATAERLVQVVGDPDLVGRGTGDEFLVTVPDVEGGAAAAELAERIRSVGHADVSYRGHALRPSVSVGVVLVTAARDPESVLKDATIAVREARAGGGDRVAFVDPVMAENAEHDLALEAAIRSGLANSEFVPWFQPIVALETRDVVGYEALVRWVGTGPQTVFPDTFLPVAERSGLITEIDDTVTARCLRRLKTLPAGVFVAVNMSAAALSRPGHGSWVLAMLEEFGVDAHRLHLEVTETSLLGEMAVVRTEMERLAAAGVKWYVDDFGTGYSSISHLRDLPISGLKLDKSFTQEMSAGDATSTRLAQALAALAHELDLDTVAEGVETEAVAEQLAAVGWRHGQGWLFGKAAPLS